MSNVYLSPKIGDMVLLSPELLAHIKNISAKVYNEIGKYGSSPLTIKAIEKKNSGAFLVVHFKEIKFRAPFEAATGCIDENGKVPALILYNSSNALNQCVKLYCDCKNPAKRLVQLFTTNYYICDICKREAL